VIGERRPALVDALRDEREPRGVVDAGGDPPDEQGERDPEQARRQRQPGERDPHPHQAADDQSLRAVGVGEHPAGERTDAERGVARRQHRAEDERRHRELAEQGETQARELHLPHEQQ